MKIQDGDWKKHWHEVEIKILEKRAEIAELVDARNARQSEMEQQCIKDHGMHKDDGGFLYGTCTRCGAHLG